MRLSASSIELTLLFLSGAKVCIAARMTNGRQKNSFTHAFLRVCGLSTCLDCFVIRNGSINQAPPVYLHSTLSEGSSVIFSFTCKSAHLQEARHACHRTSRRQSRPVTVPAESASHVQGLERICPVAGIHLHVCSGSDSGALLIYAETRMSTGTLEFSGGG